jgi:hypothetical protein
MTDNKRTREDELRERMREAVIPAFDRWGAKSFDALFSSKDQKSIQDARTTELFMSKRVFAPGFMRYVTREVVAGKDFQRQRKTLVKASLLSILHEAGVSPSELVDKSSSGRAERRAEIDPQYYGRRRVQGLLRDVYRESFSEIPQVRHGKKRIDSRLSKYSTVFSPHGSAELENPEKVREFQTMDRLAAHSNPELKKRIVLNSAIINVTPEQVDDMISFRRLCSGLMVEIGDYSELGEILAKELTDMTEIFEVFHAHILSILSIEWFRSRRYSERQHLIEQGFPLEYTEEDATKGFSLLHELTRGDRDWVVSILQIAAKAFNDYQMPSYSRIILGQLLKLRETDPLWKGIQHENIAVTFRMESKPKLMAKEMKTACKFYREAGDSYRVCIALKNLGESEWMLGYPDLARKFFGEAESLAVKLERAPHAAVIDNLAKASRRLQQDAMEIGYLKKFLETAPDEWGNLIIQSSTRLGELMR